MTILQDMDAEFVAQRPLPQGSTWLVGGNVWHALMADLVRVNREQGIGLLAEMEFPPKALFGAPFRHIPRMTGWGLAVALDQDTAEAHQGGQVELTPHEIHR